MFGKKKSKAEEDGQGFVPPPVPQAPAPPPLPAWGQESAPPAGVVNLIPRTPAGVTVTPDYAGAQALAANHLIVQGGEGKLIVDVASELRDRGDGGKQMPVTARLVMTVQTGERLVKALEQALAKLKS